jgi:orotate phosphoribosyltransferase
MQDQAIAKILLDKKSVKINLKEPFKFTSGMFSPIYVDNRILISDPMVRNIILEKWEKLLQEKFDFNRETVFAGTATAAIPWAAFLAQKMETPMVYVRPEPKAHGTGKQVEGQMKQGANVIVVEDMFSTGGSSIGSAEALKREYDANILGVIAIYSHTLAKAKEKFNEANLDYEYLTDFTTVVEMAVKENYILEEEKEVVLRWREEGEKWGENLGLK